MGTAAWDIKFNPDRKRWYLEVSRAQDPESYPDYETLAADCAQKGIESTLLVKKDQILKRLEQGPTLGEDSFSFPVTIDPAFDVRIIISPDKTKAELYIRKETGKPHDLDLKLISTVINKSKLQGMDAEAIRKGIFDFKSGDIMETDGFTIATGTPPGRGPDRTLTPGIEWLNDAARNDLCERMHRARTEERIEKTECVLGKAAIVTKGQMVYTLSEQETGESGVDVYGNEIPGLPGNDPFIRLIKNLKLTAEGVQAETDGILFVTQEKSGIAARVIPYRDGSALVRVTEDQMEAWITLSCELGAGKILDTNVVKTALTAAKIPIPAKLDRLEQAIREVRTTRMPTELLVAEGIPPVAPGGCRITWHTKLKGEPPAAIVQAGTKICTWKTIAKGENGMDVSGNVILPASGHPDPAPTTDESLETTTADDGSTTLTALIAGEVLKKGGTLTVSGSKEYRGDIDEHSGDLHFPGDLHVTGEIKSGRKVVAAQHLRITGDSGASLISGDEGVEMTGGIKGAGRGTVWSKQKIHLQYAENARILAGADVLVDNYCFQCTVKTTGKLIMQGNPAVLLGGSIQASRGVEVFELGSQKTLLTSISFGQNYLIADQIEVSERQREANQKEIAQIDQSMQKIKPQDPHLQELRKRKLDLLKQNEKLALRVFTLKEKFEAHVTSRIRVKNSVWPGVVLESHGRYYEVKERMNNVVFTFDLITGQILCEPISQAES